MARRLGITHAGGHTKGRTHTTTIINNNNIQEQQQTTTAATTTDTHIHADTRT